MECGTKLQLKLQKYSGFNKHFPHVPQGVHITTTVQRYPGICTLQLLFHNLLCTIQCLSSNKYFTADIFRVLMLYDMWESRASLPGLSALGCSCSEKMQCKGKDDAWTPSSLTTTIEWKEVESVLQCPHL